jgi:hypothetical protein
MIAALIPGAVLIEILRPFFLKVSGIQLELSAIYLESGIYVTGVIALALTVFFVSLVIFRRRTLDANIRSNKKIFRKTSIVVQLMVSIVFAFCTLIILKQMYHLHNSADLGFSFKNRSTITVSKPYEYGEYEYGEQKMSLTISTVSLVLNDKIKQIPEIKETFIGYHPLLPAWDWGTRRIIDWDGKQRDAKELPLLAVGLPEEYAKFYDLKLIEGEFLKNEDDEKYVMIDESAAKAFGWNKAAGKSFWEGTSVSDNSKKKEWVVKGVIKNIYKFSPTSAPMPSLFRQPFTKVNNLLSFKYDEGKRKICMEKINKIIEKEFPNMSSSNISYSYLHMEEEYDRYLKSENILLAILTVVSIVCVIVCVFGFVSMVSLTCEERRKEIAIRKINGATIKDILDIFFKEYLTLLVIGALIAFPVGYIIMKPWLEQYVIQTPISAWVYLSILLALIMVIVMCVGRRVYKTSRENPINAINR